MFCEMALKFFTIFFLFIIHTWSGSTTEKSVNLNSTFTPSNQWQKVADGQSLPPGLHVRINLHTGEKEAKLPNFEKVKNSLIDTGKQYEKTKNHETLEPEKLKTLLKNLKSDDASQESISGKFRSYEELKSDFSKIQIQMKTDIEILGELIENFKKFDMDQIITNNMRSDWTEDDILTILVDLEYLVHQYDNAQEFARLNGFSDVIYASLNSSNSEIRSEALRLLGSATQSNPKVQLAALDSGSVYLLLKILTFDSDINVRSRSLYALSCLIRRFPAAQQKLLTDGGLTAFSKIFDEEKQDLQKLQVKIITLIHDLLFEMKDIKMNILEETSRNQSLEEDTEKIAVLKERLQQYEKMHLEQKLVEQQWCKKISNWFKKQNHVKELNKDLNSKITLEGVNLDVHDVIEKVVDTLYILSDICKSQFQNDISLVNLLHTLKGIYIELALAETNSNDDSNQFYSSLSNILKSLTDKLSGNVVKDEL